MCPWCRNRRSSNVVRQFVAAIRSCSLSANRIAGCIGFQNTRLSSFLCGARVPDTLLVNRRFQQIADLIGFDRDRCYADVEVRQVNSDRAHG